MNTYLTIIAIDRKSSDTTSRTFDVSSADKLKAEITEFENELTYRKYELECTDFVEDYPNEIVAVLDELEVTY